LVISAGPLRPLLFARFPTGKYAELASRVTPVGWMSSTAWTHAHEAMSRVPCRADGWDPAGASLC
jgi:hypothetical protein